MNNGARLIPLALIIEEPDFNPRKDMGKADGSFIDFVESIRERGLLVPPLVRPTGDTYKVLAGHRRIAAAREIGMEDVLCVLSLAPETDDLPLSLVENLKRKDLTPMEKAKGFKRLAEERGITGREVGAIVGMSGSAVNRYIELLSLPAKTQELIERGEIQVTAGHQLARLVREGGTKTEVQTLARKAAKENLTGYEVGLAVHKSLGGKTPKVLDIQTDVFLTVPIAKKPVLDWALRRYGSLWRALEALQALEAGKPETAEATSARVTGTWADPMTVVNHARAQGWREVLLGGNAMTGDLLAVPVGPLPTGYSLIVTIAPSGTVHIPMTCPQRWQATAKRIQSELDAAYKKGKS
jgi:ParB/RepB/Spo0J family partition protein